MNPDIFTESSVSWHRMRSGLELMMSTYPAGKHNQATLLAEACRAGDGAAYFKWRESVDVAEFWAVTPNGISLEICDARFFNRSHLARIQSDRACAPATTLTDE